MAPLPAGADVETGMEDEATRDSADSGAGSGCSLPSCSFSSFSAEVKVDDEGSYYIHPVTGVRVNQPEEGWRQDRVNFHPLEPSGSQPPADLGKCQ